MIGLTFVFVSGYFVGALAVGGADEPLFYLAPAGVLIAGVVVVLREIRFLSANNAAD